MDLVPFVGRVGDFSRDGLGDHPIQPSQPASQVLPVPPLNVVLGRLPGAGG